MKVIPNPIATHSPSVDKSARTDRKGTSDALGESSASPNREAYSTVEISDQARLMQRARGVVESTPDVRADKVDSLRRQIKEGNYHVSAEAVAEKIIDDHFANNFGKNNF